MLKLTPKHVYFNPKMVSTENQNITVIYCVGKVGETGRPTFLTS